MKRVYAKDKELKLIVKLYTKYSRQTYARFRHYRSTLFRERKVPTFVSDEAQYQRIRSMIKAKRIRPMSANLLDDEGIKGVGAFSHKAKIPVRAIYLSNAEQYWNYSEQFRSNIKSLLHDDKGYLIRTLGSYYFNKDYRYYLQPIGRFIEWMSLKRIYKARCKSSVPGCSIFRLVDSLVKRKRGDDGDKYDYALLKRSPPRSK